MRRLRLTLLAGSMTLSSCTQASAPAAPPAASASSSPAKAEIGRQVLERVPIEGTDRELRLMLIEYPPLAAAPVHRHPVAGLCYVVEGTAVSRYEGEAEVSLSAGDSYQDSATKTHWVWRNPSATDPLRFICSAHIGREQPFAIPVE